MVYGIILNWKAVSRQNKGGSSIFSNLGKKKFLYLSESASQITYITRSLWCLILLMEAEDTNSLNTEFHSIKN